MKRKINKMQGGSVKGSGRAAFADAWNAVFGGRLIEEE
jgi:hypothetical protein